jgi:hypothetical protein
MLVDQIVTTHWRLRRALIAESGEIALSVDQDRWGHDRGPHPVLQWMQWQLLGDPIWSMERSVTGNEVLELWLREVRAAVDKDGELTETAVQRIVQGFGDKPNCLTRELEEFRLKLQAHPEGLEATVLRNRNKQEALAFLDRKLATVSWRKAKWEELEENGKKARQAAAVLPSMEALEKILRYETKLERQMYRAMAQLERLQRMRRGEAVPAPLAVELSERA